EGAFEATPMDEIRRQFETNVFGLIRLTQLVLPGMRRQRWGRIVNLSSMGGRLTLPGGALYHATNHAGEARRNALRFAVQPLGVEVVVVEPCAISTRFGDTAIGSIGSPAGDDSAYAAFNAQVAAKIREAYEGPMGRLASGPEAVARVIEKAIARPRPATRCPVTAAAGVVMALRRGLPARAFDAFLRRQFAPPRP